MLGLPKGPTRAKLKEARDAAEAAQITATYAIVAPRDGGCRFTGWGQAQMHEIISRAQTRGRPPAERFNTRICIMLHPDVHLMVTRNVIRITAADVAAGADGTIRFELRDAASPLWRRFQGNARAACVILRWESTP